MNEQQLKELMEKYNAAKTQGVPDTLNPNTPSPKLSIPDLAMQGVGVPTNLGPVVPMQEHGPGYYSEEMYPGQPNQYKQFIPTTQDTIQGVPSSLSSAPTTFDAVSKQNPQLANFLNTLDQNIMQGVPPRMKAEGSDKEEAGSEPTKESTLVKEQSPAQDKSLKTKSTSSSSSLTGESSNVTSSEPDLAEEQTLEKEPSEATQKKYSLNELEAKQQAAEQTRSLMAGQIQGLANVAAISGKPIDTTGFQKQYENATKSAMDYKDLINEERTNIAQDIVDEGRKVNNEKALSELGDMKQMMDPDSAVSKAGRQTLMQIGSQMGMTISPETIENLSYSRIKEIAPWVEKAMAVRETAESRRETAALRMDAAKERQEASKEKFTIGRLDKANKMISSEIASGRSAFGKGANIYRAAGAIEQLVESAKGKNGNLNNLDNRQIMELARSLDSMLSSGAATITGTNKLIPHTWASDTSKIAEYLTNRRQGAQLGDFVKNMMETVEREKAFAKSQIQETQGKLLSSYSDLQDHPTFQTMLRQHSLPPDIFEKPDKKELKPTSVSSTETKQKPSESNEEKRQTANGRTAIFDKNTKKFLRWE